jgi:hypothetical protein
MPVTVWVMVAVTVPLVAGLEAGGGVAGLLGEGLLPGLEGEGLLPGLEGEGLLPPLGLGAAPGMHCQYLRGRGGWGGGGAAGKARQLGCLEASGGRRAGGQLRLPLPLAPGRRAAVGGSRVGRRARRRTTR